MLTRRRVGSLEVVGVSVGGVYTSLAIPALDVMFDIGIAPRSFVGARSLFISHGHADHVGALMTMLGIRGLSRTPPPRTFLPQEIHEPLEAAVLAMNRTQRRGLEVPFVPVVPGDELVVRDNLWVRVFRTHHTVPSVGYELFRRVEKLKDEFLQLEGPEIAVRRKAGEDLFRIERRSEVAYVTDTLVDVLDSQPELLRSRVLILECTFLDDRKGRSESRDKGHIHLDDILERAERFENEHLLLMHFSQMYHPREVHQILAERCPRGLLERLTVFAPTSGPWPG